MSIYGKQSKPRLKLLITANSIASMAACKADLSFSSGREAKQLAAHLRRAAARLEHYGEKLERLPAPPGYWR